MPRDKSQDDGGGKYDHRRTKDTKDAGGGRHSKDDRGDQGKKK